MKVGWHDISFVSVRSWVQTLASTSTYNLNFLRLTCNPTLDLNNTQNGYLNWVAALLWHLHGSWAKLHVGWNWAQIGNFGKKIEDQHWWCDIDLLAHDPKYLENIALLVINRQKIAGLVEILPYRNIWHIYLPKAAGIRNFGDMSQNFHPWNQPSNPKYLSLEKSTFLPCITTLLSNLTFKTSIKSSNMLYIH